MDNTFNVVCRKKEITPSIAEEDIICYILKKYDNKPLTEGIKHKQITKCKYAVRGGYLAYRTLKSVIDEKMTMFRDGEGYGVYKCIIGKGTPYYKDTTGLHYRTESFLRMEHVSTYHLIHAINSLHDAERNKEYYGYRRYHDGKHAMDYGVTETTREIGESKMKEGEASIEYYSNEIKRAKERIRRLMEEIENSSINRETELG